MSNNYSVAQMASSIQRLERTVNSLMNQRSNQLYIHGDLSDDLTYLKSQFERLNGMLGVLHTSAQAIVKSGAIYDSWKQSSNVWKNVMEPLAKLLYIDGQFQNGLTRTVMKLDQNGNKYAIQGGNTLCGDVFELVVLYKNGLSKTIIPNQGLSDMWNQFCNVLSIVNELGDSLSTQSYTTEVSNGSGRTTIISNGTLGGYQHYEVALENYCKTMNTLTQNILAKIADIRIGGIGSTFGTNMLVAVSQASVGPGVSLAPYNTCAEIFNTMGAPLTIANTYYNYPFDGYYGVLTDRESVFTWANGLLTLYTLWNPYTSDYKTLIGGSSTDLMPFLSSGSATAADFGFAFGYGANIKNQFDSTFTTLRYSSNTASGNFDNLGIDLAFYFKPQNNAQNGQNTDIVYGNVSGKVVINGVGFNIVGVYTSDSGNGKFVYGADSNVCRLGGRLYYA